MPFSSVTPGIFDVPYTFFSKPKLKNISNVYFYGYARSGLYHIVCYFNSIGVERPVFLVPDFYCPEVLSFLTALNVEIIPYDITRDINDIPSSSADALIYYHAFGITDPRVLANFGFSDCLLIEDFSHSYFLDNNLPSVKLFSIRKYLPLVEGALVLNNTNLPISFTNCTPSISFRSLILLLKRFIISLDNILPFFSFRSIVRTYVKDNHFINNKEIYSSFINSPSLISYYHLKFVNIDRLCTLSISLYEHVFNSLSSLVKDSSFIVTLNKDVNSKPYFFPIFVDKDYSSSFYVFLNSNNIGIDFLWPSTQVTYAHLNRYDLLLVPLRSYSSCDDFLFLFRNFYEKNIICS